jgi:hypothetical protein
MDRINIRDIKNGDLFWECEQGQDALFVATDDAHKEPHGIGVNGREIPCGRPQHFFENDRASGYGPRLYSQPQYTRPDWPALLAGLAKIAQQEAQESTRQADARESGLKLAATQYSESRDHWRVEATSAQAEITRLHAVIGRIDDIAAQKANGITLSNRIRVLIESEKRS